MTDSRKRDDHYEMQDLSGARHKKVKLSFKDWLERYNVNKSALADFCGVTRQFIYDLASGKAGASLSLALTIHYRSAGLVDLFSLIKNGEGMELKEDLREYIRMTKRSAREKSRKINALRRDFNRKL